MQCMTEASFGNLVMQACYLREYVKEQHDSGKGLRDNNLKALNYIRELKLDVQEPEVRQTLISNVTIRVKHKNIF